MLVPRSSHSTESQCKYQQHCTSSVSEASRGLLYCHQKSETAALPEYPAACTALFLESGHSLPQLGVPEVRATHAAPKFERL